MEALLHRFYKYRSQFFIFILVVGLLLTIYSLASFSYSKASQALLERNFEATAQQSNEPSLAPEKGAEDQPKAREVTPMPEFGNALFRLKIPKIKLNDITLYGSDEATLKKGPGVIEDTSLPWLGSNTVISGHRDLFFYRFGELALGDEIQIITKDKMVLTYKITGISIVEPEEVSVMEPTPSPALTLITCWPIRWVGPAPQRLIIRAEIVPQQEDQL